MIVLGCGGNNYLAHMNSRLEIRMGEILPIYNGKDSQLNVFTIPPTSCFNIFQTDSSFSNE